MEEERRDQGRESAAAAPPPTLMSQMKKGGLSMAASIKQGWQYTKAFFTGQVMKLKAKNEKEMSEANLQATKMQVEAADEAEHRKKLAAAGNM
ncbi:uncharacterized protein M6B38_378640 [Iris pallida]|uniref:Uncharacterized protein n=1 Tax=Iris pallida TaxID=29817 RepID=A0AAX6G8X1_IRIPA|nr:uncharacterized protein M6B38_378640 [Iris pallida]